MELVEAFCAEHQVTFEEVLYDWPASKFEAIYAAFTKRKIAEELKERKHLDMAAMWGNSNYDSDKEPNPRTMLLKEAENNYNKAIEFLYSGKTEEEEEIDEDDPFFKAAKKGQEKYKLPDDHGIDQIE